MNEWENVEKNGKVKNFEKVFDLVLHPQRQWSIRKITLRRTQIKPLSFKEIILRRAKTRQRSLHTKRPLNDAILTK